MGRGGRTGLWRRRPGGAWRRQAGATGGAAPDLVTGSGRAGRTGPAVGGHHSRRPVPLRRSRTQLATRAWPVGSPRTRPVVRRRIRSSGHPFHLRGSARSAPPAGGDLQRWRVAQRRRWRQLEPDRAGHDRALHAGRAAGRSQHPGRAPAGAGARHAGGVLGPAPQWRVPQHRRRRRLARDHRRAALGVRLRGGGASARRGYRVVRAGGEGREALSGGRATGGRTHPRRRAQLPDPAHRTAGGAVLRSGLPARPGRRRQW